MSCHDTVAAAASGCGCTTGCVRKWLTRAMPAGCCEALLGWLVVVVFPGLVSFGGHRSGDGDAVRLVTVAAVAACTCTAGGQGGIRLTPFEAASRLTPFEAALLSSGRLGLCWGRWSRCIMQVHMRMRY